MLSNISIQSADTPRLLLDVGRLGINIERMRSRTVRLGVKLRPHLKSAKSVDVARLAIDPPDGRIAVSTLKEAEYFADAGYRNILYAVGIAASKMARAAALRRRGVELSLVVDMPATVETIDQMAVAERVPFSVFIEVDTDGHRAGVKPSDPTVISIGHALANSRSLRLAGVMAHAGSSYNCSSLLAIADLAEQERARTVAAAARLRAAGLTVPEVSVGSTPTALLARSLEGVTEVRAGVYMFFDLFMAGLGVCRIEDIALSVLTTVIGHRSDRGWLIADAGWMALSADRSTASQHSDQGYGLVCAEDGSPLDGVLVLSANQEHGIIGARPGAKHLDVSRFPLGTRLRILPNHACATASQHNSYLLVGTDGASPQREWPRLRGW
jgi:D-serine deaminase-like pyridoxal phosphate-dependent protein